MHNDRGQHGSPEKEAQGRSLGELSEFLGARLRGDSNTLIYRLNTLGGAIAGELTFLANQAYRGQLATTKASVVIVNAVDAEHVRGNAIIHENPYVCFARLTGLFNTGGSFEPGIHPSAVVDASANIAAGTYLGPHVVIGPRVNIGERVYIGAGSTVGDDSAVGEDTRIAANVSIYHGVIIGNKVNVHSGAVIGADGFGFANEGGRWIKIHQLGGVEIGDRVEIGACTTIDRGALGNTVIEDGVILDNHVQIAHNVRLGENTAMAGYAGVAGSTTIGKNCVFAAHSGAVGHITVCDNVHAMARCTVSKPVTEPGSYSSGLLMYKTREWRKNAVRFGQLNDMAQRLKKLERALGEKQEENNE